MSASTIDCTASLVLYRNDCGTVARAVHSFLRGGLESVLYVVDNSPTDELRALFHGLPVRYRHSGYNAGYGKGHNWAIENAVASRYHLILNPDIDIHPGTLEKLVSFMDANGDVGMVCPKVLNEDGTLQHLNRRHPTVWDLFLRRCLPARLCHLFQERLDRYEMKGEGYDATCDVPFVSGAFMLCRTSALKGVGGFDPRYFMYFEDADLSRKFQERGYRTVFYPYASVTHLWERASHKSLRMAGVLIRNGIRYFNKWGWSLA